MNVVKWLKKIRVYWNKMIKNKKLNNSKEKEILIKNIKIHFKLINFKSRLWKAFAVQYNIGS